MQYRPRAERLTEEEAAGLSDTDGDTSGFEAQNTHVERSEQVKGSKKTEFQKSPANTSSLGREHLSQLASELEVPLQVRTKQTLPAADKPLNQEEGPGLTVQLQFRLACWRVSDHLLVLDSLEPGERPDARRVTLLGNILRAIGQQPDLLPPAEFLDWPLSAGADASLAGARISIQTFLQGRMSQAPFRWVLVMGDFAIQCLAPENEANTDSSDDLGFDQSLMGQQFSLFSELTALCVPGLGQMLEDPGTKTVTWETLRFLNESADI